MSEQSLVGLEKLLDLIISRKIELCIPAQVVDEFYRDKIAVTKDFSEKLKKFSINTKAPQFLKSYKKIDVWIKTLKKLHKIQEEILKEYNTRISNPRSLINRKIKKIFSKATILLDNNRVTERAYYRTLKGNPPRKNNKSFGDAIIWETVLEYLTDQDLTIISGDRDFASEIENEKINEFLIREWSEKTKKELTFFTTLGKFINNFTNKRVVKKRALEEERSVGVARGVLAPHIHINESGEIVYSNNRLHCPSISGIFDDICSTDKYTLTASQSLIKPCSACGTYYLDSPISTSSIFNSLGDECFNCRKIGWNEKLA